MTPLYTSESQLVQDLQSKQSAAFTHLYDAYAPALFGVLLRMVNNQELAEDLLQDAFVKIWSNIHAYKPENGRLFTWLLTITRNLGYDSLRSQQVHQRADEYLVHQTVSSTNMSVHEGMLNVSLLSHLSPCYRQIMELIYYRDYTKQEVADELKLPLGTVKTRFRTALRELKHRFSQDIHYYHSY